MVTHFYSCEIVQKYIITATYMVLTLKKTWSLPKWEPAVPQAVHMFPVATLCTENKISIRKEWERKKNRGNYKTEKKKEKLTRGEGVWLCGSCLLVWSGRRRVIRNQRGGYNSILDGHGSLSSPDVCISVYSSGAQFSWVQFSAFI